jgi:SNF2 family DNA or RNA helicase
VTKGTIEERIVDLHHDKRLLAESILAEGDAAALPSTEDVVARRPRRRRVALMRGA